MKCLITGKQKASLGEKTDPKRLKHFIRLVFQLFQKFPFTYVTNN